MIKPGSDRGVIKELIQEENIGENIWKREALSKGFLAIYDK